MYSFCIFSGFDVRVVKFALFKGDFKKNFRKFSFSLSPTDHFISLLVSLACASRFSSYFFNNLRHKREAMVPGVPSVDCGNW